MKEYTPLIESTKSLLKDAGLFVDGIRKFWESIEWDGRKEQAAAVPLTVDLAKVTLFPGLLGMEEDAAQDRVITEVGDAYVDSLSDEIQDIWEKKYALPDERQIREVQGKLQNKDYASFKEIVVSFESPTDRLVAINIFNAFIVNKVSIANARMHTITTWPATEEYANRGRYHSLIPIVSSYCPESVWKSFGGTMREIVRGYPQVYHTDVQGELSSLITKIGQELPVEAGAVART